MEVGDVDGLNKVYTQEGEPILHEGEEILLHDNEFIPHLKTTWGYFGGDSMINPSLGDMYLTNQRMIFITNLEGSIQRISSTAATTSAPRSFAMKMETEKLENIDVKKGIRDYFEIPIKEILACEIKSGLVSGGSQINVYLLSKGEQVHLTFVIPLTSELLKRFKQIQVENLDELTNNLKKYFENTDWIYLEE